MLTLNTLRKVVRQNGQYRLGRHTFSHGYRDPLEGVAVRDEAPSAMPEGQTSQKEVPSKDAT